MKKESIPYPILNKEQEAKVFKSLTHLPYKEAAKENGLHLLDNNQNEKRLISWVHNIVQKIKRAPELWGISQDAVDLVQEAINSRSVRINPGLKADMAIQTETFRDKLDDMRDRTAAMIMRKLEIYGKDKKSLEDVSIRDLKDLLIVAIDKGRLLRGESTENVIRMSKIDVEGLDPEAALKVVLKARDALIEGKK